MFMITTFMSPDSEVLHHQNKIQNCRINASANMYLCSIRNGKVFTTKYDNYVQLNVLELMMIHPRLTTEIK